MKMQGGYQPNIPGQPSRAVRDIAVPGRLSIDLSQYGRPFTPAVRDGDVVAFGSPLAWADITGGCVALPAPAAGKVSVVPAGRNRPAEMTLSVTNSGITVCTPTLKPERATSAALRAALAAGGVWPLLWSLKTGGMPALDESDTPRRIIINFIAAEPFSAGGEVVWNENRKRFTAGVRFAARFLTDEGTLHLVVPEKATTLIDAIRQEPDFPGAIQFETMTQRYPAGHPRVLCRALQRSNRKVRAADGIWVLDVQAVQAIGACMGEGIPVCERLVTVSGPGSLSPDHRRVRIGTGLDGLLTADELAGSSRILRGGLFRGTPVDPASNAVGLADDGFFLLPRPAEREFMGFVNPGFDRVSILPCFATVLTGAADRHITSSLRGERRPCVACGLCEKVCPAGLMPQVIHRYLYRDALDEAGRTGLTMCIGCGLCSYVCPSKIELTHQFAEAQERLRQEQEHVAAAKVAQEKQPQTPSH